MIKCTFFRHNRLAPQEAIPPARLAFYGMTFVLDGELEYEIDSRKVRLLPGDAVLLRPGVLRARKKAVGVNYFSFHFTSVDSLFLPEFLPRVCTPAVRQLLSVCEEIGRTAESFDDVRFSTLLTLLLQELSHQIAENKEDPVVRRIKRYLSEHLSERVSLSDVGRSVSFSPNYCQTLFKRTTGQSIIGYFLDLRIRSAREMILAREDSLPEIARKTGFDDYNYFARQFKRRCGYTPTQYRRFVL